MNYIIINNMVLEDLKKLYDEYCEEYDYTAAFDTYLLSILSFDGVFRLYNRCWNKSTYGLVGKRCILYLETHKHYDSCFYAKKIEFFDDESKYLSRLVQTIELPGEWCIISAKEVFRIEEGMVQDISEILDRLKVSYKEFREFEKDWEVWDLYNSKRREAEEWKEEASECEVGKVLLDNNIFILQLEEWKKEYSKEDSSVWVQLEGNNRFEELGNIISLDAQEKSIWVRCERYELTKAYMENKVGKIFRTRVRDIGTITRLNRQRKALEKLFQEETANRNLKDIIMGEYEFPQTTQRNLTIEKAYGLFGTNMRQKEAYLGALNSDDIYLIQGPPGTGKTTIITEIVKYVIGCNMKVLVSSETNIAVDNVLERVQYMEQVVPIRLGRAERVGDECLRFMPENIVRSLLSDSREYIEDYENSGLNLDSLIKVKELEWAKKIQQTEQEIIKLQAQLPVSEDYELLHGMIDMFENLAYEVNKLYNELQIEYKDFMFLRNLQRKLQQEKNEIDALLGTFSSGVMASGYKAADELSVSTLPQYQERAKELELQIDPVLEKLGKNTYEQKKGSYQRRLRKFEREKGKLEKIIQPTNSFFSTLHVIKNAIADILLLQEQKRKYQQSLVDEIQEAKAEYHHKQELWNISADIRAEWLGIMDHTETRESIKRIYRRKTNVIFATCSGISNPDDKSFATMEYDYVIIDEAAKCNMLDLLIPLVMGKKIILVGDHKQLYPMIEIDDIQDELTKEQISILKEHILFKRLYEERVPGEFKIMLNRQYRMQKDISEFVSENFYDGSLLCEKEKSSVPSMMWIECENSEENYVHTVKSYENQAEAEVVVKLVKKLVLDSPKGTTIGIICMYKSQSHKIANLLANVETSNVEVECSTVDAFQGKEKHTIIFNTVRSNKVTSFMADENRVNVAVSRAQEFFYVVGSAEIVKTKEAGILGKLYEYIRKHGEVRNIRYVKM